MKLSMKEKKVLYAFGCTSWQNTVERLKWLTTLAVDPEAKRRLLALARKVEQAGKEVWHPHYYCSLRTEMDEYFRRKKRFRCLKGGRHDEK